MSDLLAEQLGILKKYNLAPRDSRHWGQNFLCSQKALDEIIGAAEINNQTNVLEIGPGLGVLTNELLNVAGQVVLIEQDRRWEKILSDRFGAKSNFNLVIGDALKINWQSLFNKEKYILVANLPYSITTPVLERLAASGAPEYAVLLIQKDVVGRLTAEPQTSNRGALSVIMQELFSLETIAIVPAANFYPPPKVDGAIVKIIPKKTVLDNGFCDLVRLGFAHRRKILLSNLKQITNMVEIFNKLQINFKARAQELSNDKWRELYQETSVKKQ